MTRRRNLLLHVLSFVSCGFFLLQLSHFVALAKDRDDVVTASSRAMGALFLCIAMEILAWTLLLFLFLVLPRETFRNNGVAAALFLVLLSPFFAYIVFAGFALLMITIDRDKESATLKFLAKIGGPMASHLMAQRPLFSPRSGAGS